MVVFGLYNGLVALPVVLSFIGPDAYQSNVSRIEEIVNIEETEPFKPIIKNGIEELKAEPNV